MGAYLLIWKTVCQFIRVRYALEAKSTGLIAAIILGDNKKKIEDAAGFSGERAWHCIVS